MNKEISLLQDKKAHEEYGILPKWKPDAKTRDGKKQTILPYYSWGQCARILDNVCGIENWTSEFSSHNGKMYCSVGIKVGSDWVYKSNAGGAREPRAGLKGAEMEAYKNKTEASSAFARACLMFGIGAHFDDLPSVMLSLDSDGNFITPKGDKIRKYDKDTLNNYCNKVTTSEGLLFSLYRLNQEVFDNEPTAKELLTKLKGLL